MYALRVGFFCVTVLSFFVSCKSTYQNPPSDEDFSELLAATNARGVALFAIRTMYSKSRFAFYACPQNVNGKLYRLDSDYRELCVPMFLNWRYNFPPYHHSPVTHSTHQLEKTMVFTKDNKFSAVAFLLEESLGEIGSKVLSYVRVDVEMLGAVADQDLVMQCRSTLESLHTSIVRDYKNAMFEVDKFCSKHFDTVVKGYGMPLRQGFSLSPYIFDVGSTRVVKYPNVEALIPKLGYFLRDVMWQEELSRMCVPALRSSKKGLKYFAPVCQKLSGGWDFWGWKKSNLTYLDSIPHP